MRLGKLLRGALALAVGGFALTIALGGPPPTAPVQPGVAVAGTL